MIFFSIMYEFLAQSQKKHTIAPTFRKIIGAICVFFNDCANNLLQPVYLHQNVISLGQMTFSGGFDTSKYGEKW